MYGGGRQRIILEIALIHIKYIESAYCWFGSIITQAEQNNNIIIIIKIMIVMTVFCYFPIGLIFLIYIRNGRTSDQSTDYWLVCV